MPKQPPYATLPGGKIITPFRFYELVLSGVFAIPWGLILILTPDDLFSAVRRLSTLDFIMPDWSLGLVLVIGGVSIWIIKSMRIRQILHGFFFGLWAFVGFLGLLGGFNPVAWLVSMPYFVVAVIHAGNCWFLSQERQRTHT